jgi:hypothetical protein
MTVCHNCPGTPKQCKKCNCSECEVHDHCPDTKDYSGDKCFYNCKGKRKPKSEIERIKHDNQIT